MTDPDESEVISAERAASVEASRDPRDWPGHRWVAGSWHDETAIPTGDEIA